MSRTEDVKILLGITDDKQDELLAVIERQTEEHLKSYGKIDGGIPPQLAFIVTEVMIKRYNRIGSEGVKRKSVEGHSEEYFDRSDFAEYDAIIAAYAGGDEEEKEQAVVKFL